MVCVRLQRSKHQPPILSSVEGGGMVKEQKTYPQRLSRLNFFSRLEAAELPKLLMPDEQILGVLSGLYTAGTALLCVTSKRLLLIDKKWVRLSYEDIRFESINEVNYSHQAMLASVKFYFAGRELHFRSWYRRELRILAQFVQNKMFEARVAHQTHVQAEENLAEPVASTPLNNPTNPELEKYLSERIARWRRADKFINNISAVSARR